MYRGTRWHKIGRRSLPTRVAAAYTDLFAGEKQGPMTDFENATAIQRVQALEAWEAEFRRFTATFEERSGIELEGDILTGWRWCYVELNRVKIQEADDTDG
jgi:hypothetical protein